MRHHTVHGDNKIEPFDDRGGIGEVPEADPDLPYCRAGSAFKGAAVRLQIIPDDIGNLKQRKKIFLAAGSLSFVPVPASAGPDDSDLPLMKITLQPFTPQCQPEGIGMEVRNIIRHCMWRHTKVVW